MDSGPLTITAAAPLIRSGELTPSELLEQCLGRIDVYEPRVQAWAYLDRDRAWHDAARLTDELKRGQYRGPLHGIPVGVKDIIDVFDMPTGCGSKLWANSYARRDATCVQRLRQAGAVVLGKTVTTPFAYLDPPPTRNPWNLDRTPGGSSSGSAAAVACGMVLAALGTQTGGSLTRPASYCGVCSIKPSRGRVSTEGVLPLSPKLDHVGVMANCVRDLWLIYRYLVRQYALHEDEDQIHPGHDQLPGPEDDILPRHLLTPKKLYVTRSLSLDLCDAGVKKVFCEFIGTTPFADQSKLELWQTDLPPWFPQLAQQHRTVMAVEAALTHRDRYHRRREDYPPRIAELIEEGLRCDAVRYAEADNYRITRESRREVANCFSDGVMIGPATSSPPPTPETTGSPIVNVPWSFLGFPTVSVPLGWTTDGLPIAAQIVGPGEFKELRTLRVAAIVEEAVRFTRRLPPVPPVT